MSFDYQSPLLLSKLLRRASGSGMEFSPSRVLLAVGAADCGVSAQLQALRGSQLQERPPRRLHCTSTWPITEFAPRRTVGAMQRRHAGRGGARLVEI